MANPTTNYGFVLPTPTDLVTDLPADFDVALQGVDTRLKALQPGTTAGDIAYASSTANTNVRLGIGTAGQSLTVVSGVPAWATPAPNGKILQVVQATTSTQASSTSNTYADTNLTANITPSAASSKVLVLVSQNGILKTTSADTHIGLILLRGATTIFNISGVAFANAAGVNAGSLASSFLDTPNTTSSTTYKTQFKNNNATGTMVVQDQNVATTSSIILMEVGA